MVGAQNETNQTYADATSSCSEDDQAVDPSSSRDISRAGSYLSASSSVAGDTSPGSSSSRQESTLPEEHPEVSSSCPLHPLHHDKTLSANKPSSADTALPQQHSVSSPAQQPLHQDSSSAAVSAAAQKQSRQPHFLPGAGADIAGDQAQSQEPVLPSLPAAAVPLVAAAAGAAAAHGTAQVEAALGLRHAPSSQQPAADAEGESCLLAALGISEPVLNPETSCGASSSAASEWPANSNSRVLSPLTASTPSITPNITPREAAAGPMGSTDAAATAAKNWCSSSSKVPAPAADDEDQEEQSTTPVSVYVLPTARSAPAEGLTPDQGQCNVQEPNLDALAVTSNHQQPAVGKQEEKSIKVKSAASVGLNDWPLLPGDAAALEAAAAAADADSGSRCQAVLVDSQAAAAAESPAAVTGTTAGRGSAAEPVQPAVLEPPATAPTAEELAVHLALNTAPSPSRMGAAEGVEAAVAEGVPEQSSTPNGVGGQGPTSTGRDREQGVQQAEGTSKAAPVLPVAEGKQGKGAAAATADAEPAPAADRGSSDSRCQREAVSGTAATGEAAAPMAVSIGAQQLQDALRCRVASSSAQYGGWGGTAGPGEGAK